MGCGLFDCGCCTFVLVGIFFCVLCCGCLVTVVVSGL